MISSLVYGLIALALSSQTECSVLYFQSAQCEPCRQFEPVLNQLHQQGWDVRKIEAPAQLELARQFQIKNLPTVVVLSGQREVDRIVGVVSFEQLTSRLNRVAARGRTASPQVSQQQQQQQSPTSAFASANRSNSASQPGSSQLGLIESRPVQPGTNPSSRNQPIVRGQSPGAAVPGEAFPMLAANSAAGQPRGLAMAGDVDLIGQVPPANQSSVRTAAASGLGIAGEVSRVAPVSAERAIQRATDATVRIKVEESNTIAHGTGTIVALHGDEALVLTCGHLFRDMLPGSQLSLDLFAGTPRQVNLIAQLIDFKADEEDIALLSVRLPVKIEPVPILPARDKVQKGQPVFSIGCDHGNNPTRHDTRISNVNRYLGAANIEISGAPAVGRSGGGLFDAGGRLLGVCNAACKEDNEGIYAGAEVVYQQLSRIGMSALFDGSASLATAERPSSTNTASLANHVGSSTGSTVSTTPQPISTGTAGSAQWPDEDPRLGPISQANVDPQSISALPRNVATEPATGQLICIVRDGSGKERVMTIPQPSTALLQALEQQSTSAR